MQFEVVLTLLNGYYVLYKDMHLNYTGVVETRMQWFLIKMPSPKMDNAFPSFPSPVFSLV